MALFASLLNPSHRRQQSLLDDFLFSPMVYAISHENSISQSFGSYQFHEDENGFEIAMEVPGVQVSDLTVQLLDDERILQIKGRKKTKLGKENSKGAEDETRKGENGGNKNVSSNAA